MQQRLLGDQSQLPNHLIGGDTSLALSARERGNGAVPGNEVETPSVRPDRACASFERKGDGQSAATPIRCPSLQQIMSRIVLGVAQRQAVVELQLIDEAVPHVLGKR
ncbi:hypothetical protein ACFOPN_12370 [Xanthomonas hyacinthi]|uniref:hypothetical protein n=1 Tax=Xanthomonas hyacinthi TaxID=56455 RepID=UPI0036174E37